MNFVYKLIFNISTGTWAVAHELAVSRGKKSRTRLAKAMAVALALPAGAAMAADSPAPLECSANEVKSQDGMLCETVRMLETRATSMATRGATDGGSATGNGSTAVGSGSQATGVRATAMGINAVATGKWTTSYGAFTNAVADGSIAIGNGAAVEADGKFGTAIGYIARAKAENSVALGSGAVADSSWTVSVGNDNTEQRRRIVHVAAGRGDSDAATVGQLTPLIAGLGGGAAIDAETGAVTGPTYKIDGKDQNLGEAIAGLGDNTQALKDKLTSSGLVAEDGKAIAAVTYDRDIKGETNFGSVTMGNGTGPVKLKNVAVGTANTDAVNVGQLNTALTKAAQDDVHTFLQFGATGASSSGNAVAGGAGAVAVGRGANAAKYSVAVGGNTKATGDSSTAIGIEASAVGAKASALGWKANAAGERATAVGFGATAEGAASVALGGGISESPEGVVTATGALSSGENSVAIGVRSKATAKDAVALGSESVAGSANSFSIGNDTLKRTIINVAAGKAATDAVNVSQLSPLVAGLGGGAAIDPTTGAVTGPAYKVDGKEQKNLGDALTSLDAGTSALKETLASSGLVAADGKALAAVSYDRDIKGVTNYGSVTLGNGKGAVSLKNVAAGTDDTDAVNMTQLKNAMANATPAESTFLAGKGGGTAAKATGFNSVALGINSVADQANTVSVGSASGKRRITNLASAQEESDAATYGQVTALVGNASSSAQRALKDVNTRLSALSEQTGRVGLDSPFLKIDAPEGSEAAVVDLNNSAVAIGASTSAIGSIATAIGGASYAKGSQAAAIGGGAYAEGQGALAMGSARAEADNSTALGNGARATGAYTLAIGANARSAGMNGVALGNSTRANADNAVAIGNLANIDATATNSMAFGRNASVGAGATNAMSLGSSSTNLRANTVSVGSLNNERQITNVAAGTAETDAVNFSQLKKYVGENGGSGGAANPLAVAYTDADKGTVSLAGAEGTILSNVKAGSADTDAANVGQVKGVAAAIGGGASIAADGSVTAPSFTIGGGRYSNVGETFAAVDTSLTDLDGRVTGNSSSVTNLSKQFEALTAGTSGMVTFDAASNTVKVASAQAGTTVDFANSDNEARTLTNVAAGSAEGDAVNVAQLKGTAQSVAAAIGGGSVVNADGTVSQPSYTVGGTTVTNFGDAITNIDDRTTTNATELTTLGTTIKELSNGTSGLVTVDQVTGNVQVAAAQGGTLVDMEGTDGKRRVSGVANGTEEDDVVTIAQLRAAGAIDPVSGQTLSVLTYDGADLSRATLGGSHGTVLANVASGFIGAGSMEAINGGQLFDMNAAIQGRMDGLDGRVGTIEKGIAEGSIGSGNGSGNGNGNGNGNPAGDGAAEGGLVGPGAGEGALIVGGGSAGGSGAVSVGDGSKAEGDSSIAVGGGSSAGTGSISVGGGSSAGGTGAISVGEGSAASGTGSVAIGEGAKVTNDNSVAIGSGSTTTRDNEVSMGSAGSERVVSNVAAGIQGTDAVNLQQMDDRFKAEHDWSNSRFQSMDKRIDRMGAISAAYAGMAINTAGLSGDNRLGAGIGSQNGRSALAVGYQRILGEKKNVSVSLGGAFSGSDQSVSAGAGISW